jgi:hypothetical protein
MWQSQTSAGVLVEQLTFSWVNQGRVLCLITPCGSGQHASQWQNQALQVRF